MRGALPPARRRSGRDRCRHGLALSRGHLEGTPERPAHRISSQLLKDLHPGFLRFPGGCIVEGRFLDGRYQWKTTIGDLESRRLIVNRWNDEFAYRPAPDYYQSFGLGFFEYFQLAEDIGAEPLPILNCGMACQFNSNELAPLDAIDPYIQDALDLIEFANGPVTSDVGREARRDGASGAVQPEDARRRQRAVGAAVRRALRALREGAEGEASRDQAGRRAPDRFPPGEQFDFLWTQDARAQGGSRRRALLHAAGLVPDQRASLRRLSAHRAEGVRGRVRRAPAGAARATERGRARLPARWRKPRS